MSKEQGERLADLASQASLSALNEYRAAQASKSPTTGAESSQDFAADLAARAADQLNDKN